MFVRTIDQIKGTDKEMILSEEGRSLQSLRILTKVDGCGFSVSVVRVNGGWDASLWYKNHVEINYIPKGQIELIDLSNKRSWKLNTGSLYVVGPKDRHRLAIKGNAEVISIFNPAIYGTEKHDADGAFEASGNVPNAWIGEKGRDMFIVREEDARKITLGDGRTKITRYLTAANECGITVSMPRCSAEWNTILWYKNHVEANLVLDGEGSVEDLTTGEQWDWYPSTLYVVGPKDRHRLRTKTAMHFMSIFNPALEGDETHDADGSFPPTGDIPSAWLS